VSKTEIEYSKTAAKIINSLDRPTKQRIKAGIEGLPDGDIKLLQGFNNIYRLRIGKYRVLYEYRNIGSKQLLYIKDVGPRGDIYK
jgi:mRNA interferase RelE/StbE